MKHKKVMELNYVIAKMLSTSEFDAEVLTEKFGDGFQSEVCESMLALAIRLGDNEAVGAMLELGVGDSSPLAIARYASRHGNSEAAGMVIDHAASKLITLDLYQYANESESDDTDDDNNIKIVITVNTDTGEAALDVRAETPEQALGVLKAARKELKRQVRG